ncbi:MAG TPA: mechanosensitive ion channel domain-containing protein [Burkholderiales bacterium]|nr:mechanosensitive ion channel domain-containing protein [Burkholderiales bacterium]
MKNDSLLYEIAPEVMWTIVIVSAVILANITISAVLRGRGWLSRETKLRASVFWRNFSLLVAFIALIFIWRVELRAAALSLAALSVALVIAGKELFTSVLGYVHRTTSGSFTFGDVIEINNIKGEVIDQTLLSTTVLEMSEEHLFTGRVVQFPNSFYVSNAMKNYSRLGDYQLGMVTIPLAGGTDVETARRILSEVATAVCSEFVAPAHAALRELEGEQFIVMPSAEPRVSIRLGDGGKTTLLLRFPCPASQRTRTEQELLTRYLAGMRSAAAS